MDLDDLKDKAEGLIEDNPDKVKDAIGKVAEAVDDKTDGKHRDKIDDAVDKLEDAIDDVAKE
jgi:uncharacterized protein YjbJ (UPF0337 family)